MYFSLVSSVNPIVTMHLNMVSGRLSRFTPIPATPEMDAMSEEDPDWSLPFLKSFPSTIRDNAGKYHAILKKNGFGTKEFLKGLVEQGLITMKFLLSDVRAIMAQLELLFAPVALPAFNTFVSACSACSEANSRSSTCSYLAITLQSA